MPQIMDLQLRDAVDYATLNAMGTSAIDDDDVLTVAVLHT
jgi:hypothetical protein